MISQKVANIPPFYVMEVLERAQQLEAEGKSIIHLEIGEPDFPTAPHICEAAHNALDACNTTYTHSQGIPELREAITEDYNTRFNLDIDPSQVVVTSGTSPALMLSFMALVDEGMKVAMSNPHYACYPNFVKAIGGKAVLVPTKGEEGYCLNSDNLSKNIDVDTSAILINSPSNPAGYMMPPEEMESIADLAGEIPIISDEIYQGIVYGDAEDHSILEYTDNAIVLNGFSKKYCMTGWRLGYMIVPPNMIRLVQKMQQNFFICANNFVQHAAVAALTGPQDHVKSMVETYDKRRIYMLEKLKDIGFGINYTPNSAFYILADANKFTGNSLEFSRQVLEETGVAITPGIDFGSGAEGHVRFSYANSLGNIEKGMERLDAFLNG
ncbi:pyridoxal phosphate-dependent aminotransferase [Methanohalophilus portucalensis]|uniref:Aminotransferase class I and II n=2 Tax=Methanohalophilus portucalensis TaxID=39664 RepID=A0A1L9C437_9EURY|nr:pyridoxal phosphate-dependent aminotransferase [Methanohalophilus portucalensis]ATU07878.1 aspartate aminotransferase [Methanohalophilus portucalensis]OJH49292.1 aminotransferase class I and II [Methanohalophilus portucalensis FDF-1]RNI11594.1 pyridoxal phosphate-dependent aminotransferase [Methanohalophilus portucalensis FDF-1]SMH41955.1 L-aspartate aminotransferase apoenzyme [Methanohalophilus portucalensis FDF-1]